MPHAQIAAEVHILGQRQHAPGTQNTPVADNDGAVMHGCLHEEDVLQQLGGHGGIQRGAAAHHVVQLDVPLEHDEHAGLGLGHLAAGDDRLVNGSFQLRLLLGRRKRPQQADVLAAQLFQDLTDLRLEQDDEGQNAHLHHVAQNIGDAVEMEDLRQPQGQQEHHHALEDVFRPRALDQIQQLVDQERDDDHVQNVRKTHEH